jgi:hypothetical protein
MVIFHGLHINDNLNHPYMVGSNGIAQSLPGARTGGMATSVKLPWHFTKSRGAGLRDAIPSERNFWPSGVILGAELSCFTPVLLEFPSDKLGTADS